LAGPGNTENDPSQSPERRQEQWMWIINTI
jgi:hypothetical protein